jgi:hypothetical protein
MKRSIIISFLLLCFTFAIRAQENTASAPDSRNKLHFGIKAGLNYSNIYDEQEDEFTADPKFGFAGGAFLSIPIGKYLGVRPEVLFSQKGFYAERRYLEGTYSFSRTTSYIDVPLLVEFKPVTFLTIVGGPQYSYLLNQTDIFKDGNSTAVQQEDFANDNLRKNTLGAIVGLDVNISRLVLGARYAVDMQNNNGDGSSSIPRYKNQWLQGTVGIRF